MMKNEQLSARQVAIEQNELVLSQQQEIHELNNHVKRLLEGDWTPEEYHKIIATWSVTTIQINTVSNFVADLITNDSRTIGQVGASGPFDVIEVEHIRSALCKFNQSFFKGDE